MKRRPNIVFIFTDQQSYRMMGCAGNRFVRTPAMDSLAASGVRFDRAYCTNPVCVPSRFSLMTGLMPGVARLRSNEDWGLFERPAGIPENALGHVMRRAGYDTVYGGKVHLPLTPKEMGFEVMTDDERDGLADASAEYIRRRHDRPFLLVVSFINPHDICYLSIRASAETDEEKGLIQRGAEEIATLEEAMRLPAGMERAEFFATRCPPLPPNFEPQADEPEAIRQLLDLRPFRSKARRLWGDEDWRMHRWAYARLTEMVDAQVGRVLTAIRESGQEENTVIIFSSDHGDMDGAHRMEHKTVLYEETVRVPLIVSQAGVTPAGFVNKEHLVSNGLDLLPTLCDYAGIEPPKGLPGLSFRRLAEGKSAPWRQELPVETDTGDLLVTGRYKYALYRQGRSREQLADLQADPWEMRNCAGDADKAAELENLRRLFANVFGDPLSGRRSVVE